MSGGVCGIGDAGGFRQFLSMFGLKGRPFSAIICGRKGVTFLNYKTNLWNTEI